MSKVVLATTNRGKVTELQALLEGHALHVVPQSEFAIPDIEEKGLTFVENALVKARHAARHSDLPAIADDSGLVVPALGGAPGIYSARYAGALSNATANNEKLLQEMKGFTGNKRRAYFFCALVYLRHVEDPTPIICQARWHGAVLTESTGKGGFGYDPLFFVPSHGCSAAELPKEVKNSISHRGQALQQLLSALGKVASD